MPFPDEPVEPFAKNPEREVPTTPETVAAVPFLHADHAAKLAASAISPTVIEVRGYYTATSREELSALKISDECSESALMIPIWNLDGEKCLVQAKPDHPRTNKKGELAKYELPKGSRRKIDVPPGARERVLDVTIPLFITVGVCQADAAVSKGLCCIALLGNSGWKKQEAFWDRIPLVSRVVYLVFDSDLSSRIAVQRQAVELKEFLESRSATVKIVRLAPRTDHAKVGLDDFFAAGQSVEDLLALATADVPSADTIEPDEAPQYVRTKQGLCLQCHTDKGELYLKPLCNCDIRIAVELTVTDGISERKELEIEAILNGETFTVCIPIEEFNRMDWIVQYFGTRAVIYAGNGVKDHLRAAIQLLSLDTMATRTVYMHTGWITDHLGRRLFLHADGAIGADISTPTEKIGPNTCDPNTQPGNDFRRAGLIGPIGPQKKRRVALPPIARLTGPLGMFRLPVPPPRQVLQDAVRASLKLLDLAPDHISMPLLAATYRAPLGNPFYTLAVDGITGRGKTTFVAMFQQHLGFEMDHESLPGSFRCSPIYLEGLAYRAKDVLFTVDDLAPTGSKADVERLNRDAEHFLRAVGNRSGRGRCDRDGTPRIPVMPRAQVVITQEQAPEGHSLNARIFRVQAKKYDILAPNKLDRLRACQRAGAEGVYAQAMSGYLQWLATNYERVEEDFRERRNGFRNQAHTFCSHPRTAAIIADLLAGFEVFLDFCEENEVIGSSQYDAYWQRMHDVLIVLAEEQEEQLKTHDPVDQFFELLQAALLSRACHVEELRGGAPDEAPDAWGWRAETYLVQKTEEVAKSEKAPSKDAENGPCNDRNATKKLRGQKSVDNLNPSETHAGDAINTLNAKAAKSPAEGDQTNDETLHPPKATDPAKPDSSTAETWCEERERWRACGLRIGFIEGDHLYLIPKMAIAAAQRQDRDMGLYFTLTERSLGRYLDDSGKLVAKERDYRVRRNAAGKRPWLLFVNATEILKPAFVGQFWEDPEYQGPPLESLLEDRARKGLPTNDLMDC